MCGSSSCTTCCRAALHTRTRPRALVHVLYSNAQPKMRLQHYKLMQQDLLHEDPNNHARSILFQQPA
jgi:hypothetical protein